MSATGPLRWEQRDDHLFATLSRPEARNAIDADVIGRLHDLCAELEQRPQVLVLTGAGGIFAAGADISQLRERRSMDALRGINSRAFDRLAKLPMPTIAVVDGAAVGGGAELAYACDLRIATPAASFANPEPGLGIIAGAGAGWRLRELVGGSVARQVLLAGRRIDADAALRLGLVLDVIEPEAALAFAAKLATRIAASAPDAIRLTKLVLSTPEAAHPAIDDIAQAVLFGSDEATRRMTAFLEKTS